MKDKVQKIREEVQRLQNELIQEKEKGFGSDVDDACILELQNVLTYIDSLQEDPVSEDLEEAAKHYLYSNILYDDVYVGNPTDKDCIEMFKAGAKWQKEQLMAKAKSGTVQKDNQVILDDGAYIDLDPSMQLKPSFVGLKEGDRIKVVVIKED